MTKRKARSICAACRPMSEPGMTMSIEISPACWTSQEGHERGPSGMVINIHCASALSSEPSVRCKPLRPLSKSSLRRRAGKADPSLRTRALSQSNVIDRQNLIERYVPWRIDTFAAAEIDDARNGEARPRSRFWVAEPARSEAVIQRVQKAALINPPSHRASCDGASAIARDANPAGSVSSGAGMIRKRHLCLSTPPPRSD